MTDYKELAKNLLSTYNYKYACYGIRHLAGDENYNIGDFCRNSYDWDFENDCSTYDIDGEDGEDLGGTCAIAINTSFVNMVLWDDEDVEEFAKAIEEAVKKADCYVGETVVIASDGSWAGFDDDEEIFENAVVVAKL